MQSELFAPWSIWFYNVRHAFYHIKYVSHKSSTTTTLQTLPSLQLPTICCIQRHDLPHHLWPTVNACSACSGKGTRKRTKTTANNDQSTLPLTKPWPQLSVCKVASNNPVRPSEV
jgi:hypothetical protein